MKSYFLVCCTKLFYKTIFRYVCRSNIQYLSFFLEKICQILFLLHRFLLLIGLIILPFNVDPFRIRRKEWNYIGPIQFCSNLSCSTPPHRWPQKSAISSPKRRDRNTTRPDVLGTYFLLFQGWPRIGGYEFPNRTVSSSVLQKGRKMPLCQEDLYRFFSHRREIT